MGRTYALCLRMTANPELAEELTQEVFVQAWRKLDSFRGESSFAAWMRRLAIHAVLADRRSRGRRRTREHLWSEAAELRATDDDAERAGAGLDLERALSRLPEGARTVFVLHDVEGYRHDEIAGLLGVTAGTTKAQLHRARRLLREALQS